MFLYVCVEGGGDAGVLGRGSLEVEAEAGFADAAGGGGSEGGYTCVALTVAGEVLEEGLDAAGAEEDEHVVVEGLVLGDLVADGAVHDAFGEFDVFLLEELGEGGVVDVALGDEEAFGAVAEDLGEEVVDAACVAVEDFALAVLDVLLDVEGDGLGDAEIFHVFGDVNAHLPAELEEVVDGVAAGEDDGGVAGDVDVLVAELAGGEGFDFDEGVEGDLDAVLAHYVVVW